MLKVDLFIEVCVWFKQECGKHGVNELISNPEIQMGNNTILY